MIDIKQYLKETNSVLLTEQNYKYLKEKADVIEKLEEIKSDMDIIVELEAIKAEFEDKILLNQTVAIQIIDKHLSELKGEDKKECSTCKSDNSLKNCLGCIEYGHWEPKGENKQSKCKHCLNTDKNEIGEIICFCEEYDEYVNVTQGNCFGNCEMEETELKGGQE